jgi:hypothetical protein
VHAKVRRRELLCARSSGDERCCVLEKIWTKEAKEEEEAARPLFKGG